jgi:hypothetical protein
MAWRTYVAAVDENPVPNDSIFITVEFRDVASTPPRSFQQTYKYASGMSITDVQNDVRAKRDALRAFDSVRTTVKGMIGQEVT